MLALPGGIRRVTMPLPTRPGHVHCYLLPGEEGWTLVDTGLGLPDAAKRWGAEVAELDGPVARIVITHFHPDHVGAAADVAALTGTAVHQGALDYEQCERVWGSEDWDRRIADWFLSHGVPHPVAEELLEVAALYRPYIRFAPDPVRVREGESLDGWTVLDLPGHADGHIALLRDGVLIAGDHVLPAISPAIGLWPESRPDPLGDYLESLERTAALGVDIALPGHGEPMEDVAARCRELVAHHRERLDETERALAAAPRTAYDISLDLFPDASSPPQRRFAVAETLSHLERLVVEGRGRRGRENQPVTYTASSTRAGRRPTT